MAEIDRLIENLGIVDANILHEAARQPHLFIDASRYRVDCMRDRAQADARVAYLSARIATLIRQRYRDAGRKISEAQVKEQVAQNKKLREAQAHADNADAEEEFAKLLLDAYKQRRDAIRVTAEAQIYEGMRDSHELDRLEERTKLRNTARTLAESRQQR